VTLPARPDLAATLISGSDEPRHTVVMLHGIYGRGRNWQAIARAIAAARSDYGCWLVDLPHHGDSGPGRHGDTVAGLAADLDDWLRANDITTDAILGHSYGGKVALAYAKCKRTSPLQVWIIDSTPEVKQPSGSAWDMLAIVRRLPGRFTSREEVVNAIVAGGFSAGVAQWMATNLVRDDGGFVWRLDFDTMERLLLDFFSTDLWDVVESPPANVVIHFIKASESSAISPEAVRRIESAPSSAVHLHHLEGGHWVHAESPESVTALLLEHLRRE
jgi:esterase